MYHSLPSRVVIRLDMVSFSIDVMCHYKDNLHVSAVKTRKPLCSGSLGCMARCTHVGKHFSQKPQRLFTRTLCGLLRLSKERLEPGCFCAMDVGALCHDVTGTALVRTPRAQYINTSSWELHTAVAFFHLHPCIKESVRSDVDTDICTIGNALLYNSSQRV